MSERTINRDKKLIAIIGPTASGKSDWGVEIAKKCNGEIVSADSRQVYRGFDIGTGKEGAPSAPNESTKITKVQKYKITNKQQFNNLTIEQLRSNIRWIDGVPQWLIDIIEPGTKFTMFDWLAAARKVVEDIFARGKIPIIVGGTGLYTQALIEGFMLGKSEIRNPNVEKYSRGELENKTLKQLQKIFSGLEIRNWKLEIDLNNPHRLIRAIERAQAGEVVAKKKPDFEVLQIAIDLPREVLYRRIDQRVDDWFHEGFVTEVGGLLDRGVDPKWLEKIGLEYRILTQYLIQNVKCKDQNDNSKCKNVIARSEATKQSGNETMGQCSNEFLAMKREMKFAIHAYARRQLTWFRRFPKIIWCKDLKSAEKEIEKFLR